MATGGADKNIMLWTCPLDGNQTQETSYAAAERNPEGSLPSHVNASRVHECPTLSADELVVDEIPTSLISTHNKSEGFESEMKVMDYVMVTLDNVVTQLDIMNQNMTVIEKRISDLENKNSN